MFLNPVFISSPYTYGQTTTATHKPNATGYVNRLLHWRKHTNNTDMIWKKNTLNSKVTLIFKQHYKHGTLFFLFSIHADFKIVRQHVSMYPEFHKNNINEWSLPQQCSVRFFKVPQRNQTPRWREMSHDNSCCKWSRNGNSHSTIFYDSSYHSLFSENCVFIHNKQFTSHNNWVRNNMQ